VPGRAHAERACGPLRVLRDERDRDRRDRRGRVRATAQHRPQLRGADDHAGHHLLAAALWGLSTAAASGVGVLSEMSALQSRPAIQVAPVVFVTQTVVPVVLAPLLLGERFGATPLSGGPLVASLLLLVVGAALLARSPLLLALLAGARTSPPSGPAPSRSDPSQEMMRSSPTTEEADPSSSTTSTSPARIGR